MFKVRNLNELGTTTLRRTALAIAEAGLEAIDTVSTVKKAIELSENTVIISGVPWRADKSGKIYFVGVGKCATETALAIEEILGERLCSGLVIDVREPYAVSKKIRFLGGTHPFPSEKNVMAAKEVVEFLKKVTARDLVIFAVSGGGSNLLCLPTSPNNQVEAIAEEKMILKRLFAVGATIREINTVRKHLSLARGGHLAKYIYPARAVALIFSDVPGNELDMVASGPTARDETTVEEAKTILDKYEIWEICKSPGCGLIETPKDPKYFENVINVFLVSNMQALKAMYDKASELGFSPRIVSDRFQGEAQKVAEDIVQQLHRAPHNSALIYGGESTVTLGVLSPKVGSGRGGRNAEMALSALRFVEDGDLVLTVASDGLDNGDYAGALSDSLVKRKAQSFGLDIGGYLKRHDSAKFFEQTGDYLLTGYTGSNVSDLIVAMKV